MTTKPKYITIQRAAEELGITHWTLRRWIDQGVLPATQIGGPGKRLLIHKDDLNELIARDLSSPTG